MEDGMHIGNLLQHVEDAPDGVADAAAHEQPQARPGDGLDERREEPDDAPAHEKIQHGRHPARTKHPERLAGDARKRHQPYERAQLHAAGIGERDKAERRVGTGDEQVDAAVVEHLEHAFRALVREGVVQGGHGVLEQHGERVHERGEQEDAASVVERAHDEDGKGRYGQQDADPMRDGVGDLLSFRILANAALFVRGPGRRAHAHASTGFRLELRRRPAVHELLLAAPPARGRGPACRGGRPIVRDASSAGCSVSIHAPTVS